jgi:hypothetical protein
MADVKKRWKNKHEKSKSSNRIDHDNNVVEAVQKAIASLAENNARLLGKKQTTGSLLENVYKCQKNNEFSTLIMHGFVGYLHNHPDVMKGKGKGKKSINRSIQSDDGDTLSTQNTMSNVDGMSTMATRSGSTGYGRSPQGYEMSPEAANLLASVATRAGRTAVMCSDHTESQRAMRALSSVPENPPVTKKPTMHVVGVYDSTEEANKAVAQLQKESPGAMVGAMRASDLPPFSQAIANF